MSSIAKHLQQVEDRISRACSAAGRPSGAVTLIAVSKTQPAAALREAHAAGQRHFGENYVQEALDKMTALVDLRAALTWHFIGPLQSNKTRVVAQAFDWVHSVDRLKTAQRLSEQRPPDLPPLNICLQVNVSAEPSKSGLAPAEVLPLAQAVAALPRLVLRGLMAIPEPAQDAAAQRVPHQALHALLNELRAQEWAQRWAQRMGQNAAQSPVLDTLSMGMSADLEAAVLEGATQVRVGTAIFGARAAPVAATAQAACKWGSGG